MTSPRALAIAQFAACQFAAVAVAVAVAAGCLGEDAPAGGAPSPDTPDAAAPLDARPADPVDGAAAACPADQTACGTTCVTLASDAKNCGTCGRDCAGGACTDSRCGPVVIAKDVASPYGVSVVGPSVFWVRTGKPPLQANDQSGAVESCSTAGCGGAFPRQYAEVPSPKQTLQGSTVLSDGVSVQFLGRSFDNGDPSTYVYACPLVSQNGCRVQAASGGGSSVTQIVRVGERLFFRAEQRVMRCPFGTCSTSPVNNTDRLAGIDFGGTALAANARFVYFDEPFNGSIKRAAPGADAGAPSSTLFDLPGGVPRGVTALSTSGSRVVVATADGARTRGALLSCDEDPGTCGNAPAILANDIPPIVALASDATTVYFATNEPLGDAGAPRARVLACPIATAGCPGGPRVVLGGLFAPSSLWLAQDGLLYVAERGNGGTTGAILKVRP